MSPKASRRSSGLANKAYLDQTVATMVGVPVETLRGITQAFLDVVTQCLVRGDVVQLDGLGHLHVYESHGRRAHLLTLRRGPGGPPRTVKVKKRYHVAFKKAVRFTDLLYARGPRYKAKTKETDPHGQVRR